MKKTIALSIVGGFMVGAIISPVVGMAVSSTRNLILEMAPKEAILLLADKIDQEAGRNDEQEEKIKELNKQKNQQEQAMVALKEAQDMAVCKKRKEDCESKIYELENGELQINRPGVWKGSRTEMIIKLQDLINTWEKEKERYKKEEKSSSRKENLGHIQDAIDNAETEVAKIKKAIKTEQAQKQELLNSECKNYEQPCE